VPAAPLVTVLLAVHDGEPYVRAALASVLGQTVSDLELLVVDDASGDGTPGILAALEDVRVRVLRNDEQRGLAASLNRGLGEARGAYVARLDADDVAMPRRLERQLARIRSAPNVAIVGSAVLELDEAWRVGAAHAMPAGVAELRWASLFSSPFFHPSVLVERDVLERNGLRYDTGFEESEDYDLWARLLEVGEGDNLADPLVLYRVHPEQASQRRRELQRECQLRVASRLIQAVAPALDGPAVDLAWRVGAGEPVSAEEAEAAADAYRKLVAAFETRWGRSARKRAARDLLRLARSSTGSARAGIVGDALRLDPALPGHVAGRRRERRRAGPAREEADRWLARIAPSDGRRALRVAAVFPEPTPYRAPLLDRVAANAGIDLTVVYAADTVASRTWHVESVHEAVFLRGVRVPGARRILHHDYPLTPGVVGALANVRPDVVVVSGWSTFAAQAAIAWCRLKGVPYVLVVESHDEGPRPGWRRTVKGTVVPPIVERAAGLLVTGTLARDSMIARGAHAERVRIFANTIDVEAFGDRADRLAGSRPELRRALGAGQEDVVVLSVARLAREKGLDVLLRAVAAADDPRLLLVVAGEGPQRGALAKLADDLSIRLVLAGDVDWERIVELYVAADIFALLSEREPWAVVVNEAAACALPLVLSDRVGAAHDLLRDGENGALVAAGDVAGAAQALGRLAADPELRRTQGSRSRELARDWGYGPSVEGFVEAVREAVTDRG
jgi:glycosyltransferase involved in cell wall biosynthesis/GT2 family glycosyltransferase